MHMDYPTATPVDDLGDTRRRAGDGTRWVGARVDRLRGERFPCFRFLGELEDFVLAGG